MTATHRLHKASTQLANARAVDTTRTHDAATLNQYWGYIAPSSTAAEGNHTVQTGDMAAMCITQRTHAVQDNHIQTGPSNDKERRHAEPDYTNNR